MYALAAGGLDGEVFADDFVGEGGDGAAGDDGAAVHDGEAVGELFAEVEILFDEEDAHLALGAEHADGFADLVDDVGLNAFGGLVEDEDFGLGEEGTGDGELLLLATGEHAAFAGEEVFEDGEEAEDALELFGAAFGFALGFEAEVEVFLDGEVGKNVAALGNVAEAGAGAMLRAAAGDFLVVEGDGAGVGGLEADDALQSGGFADAVAAHEAEDAAIGDVEADAAEDLAAADGDVEVGDG